MVALHMASASSLSTPSPADVVLCDDWFLAKICSLLLEDGLQECRRVCRKWKAVCDQMPVKLGFSRNDDLFEALQKFPNAVEIVSYRQKRFRSPEFGLKVTGGFLHSLCEMPNLKSLVLLRWRGGLEVTHFPPNLFTIFKNLKRFRFSFEPFPESAVNAFLVSALRCLTDVTSLAIEGSICIDPFVDSQPLTELTRLRDLFIHPSLLRTQRGRLPLFPSSPLTRLRFSSCGAESEGHPMDAVLYAATLRSLDLADWNRTEELRDEWEPFVKKLLLLESLTMDGESHGGCDVLRSLGEMHRLTELGLTDLHCCPDDLSKLLFGLTSLRSLTVLRQSTNFMSLPPLLHCSSLRGLTQLDTNIPFEIPLMSSLTNLASLKIHRQVPFEVQELLDHLAYLPELRQLEVTAPTLCISYGSAVKHLLNLTSLSLQAIEIDAAALEATLCLSKLTYLALTGNVDGVSASQVLETLGSLRDLADLRIDVRGARSTVPEAVQPSIKQCPWTRLLNELSSGRFQHLRYLKLKFRYWPLPESPKNLDRILVDKFPCLREWLLDYKNH